MVAMINRPLSDGSDSNAEVLIAWAHVCDHCSSRRDYVNWT